MSTVARRLPLLTAALALFLVAPAGAQIPPLGELPLPDPGAVGDILDPVEELVDEIVAPIEDALGDVPFDNAVSLLGEDAVEAAIALSQATFETSSVVLLARDDVFADTLSSVAAQGIAGAPLLLTPTLTLDQRVIDELARLAPQTVIVLGNELAVDPSVEQFVSDLGYDTVRAGGPTRIETAVEIATLLAPDADTALLLRAYPDQGADQAQAYADALAVGPLGSRMRWPVLLTTTDAPHPATMEWLAESDVSRVVIVGGDAAVAPVIAEAVAATGLAVDRIAGPNRFATAIAVANEMGFANAADPNRLILSEAGESALPLWAAGFAAAAHGAVFGAPVLLTDGAILPLETIVFIADGLLVNALRLSNEPIICNSFVSLIACETASLLTLGLLDEANALTGGALGEALGPVLDQIIDLIDGQMPRADGVSPAMVVGLLDLIGHEGDDPSAFTTVAPPLGPSMRRFAGADGAPRSTSAQAVLIALLARVQQLLGDTTVASLDPLQNGALSDALDSITPLLDEDATALPLDSLETLLTSLQGLLDATGLADVVAGAGVDVADISDGLVADVTGLLRSGGDSGVLVERYGSEAAALAEAVDRART